MKTNEEEFARVAEFLAKGKALADEAEALGDELLGWGIHRIVLEVGRRHDLTELEALDLMGYEDEDEEPSDASLMAATAARLRVFGMTDEEEKELLTEAEDA